MKNRDLIIYALPEIKKYILEGLEGDSHLFERQLTSDEVQMLRDFLLSLYPYASEDFKVWLIKGYNALEGGKTLGAITEELMR